MTSRERVLKALAFENTGPVTRVPMDLGGMNSTGISCFAYPRLVAALGLPPRRPRVHDTGQMLALPDLDVLDALGCDVVPVFMDITSAYPQPGCWRDYDFGGRLAAQVRDPEAFSVREEGVVAQGESIMPRDSYVFTGEHAGQPLLLSGDIPKPDLGAIQRHHEENPLREEDVAAVAEHCRRAREATDRAILFNGPGADIGIAAHTGIAMFPMLCMTEPDFVHELHDLIVTRQCEWIAMLLDAIHPYIDVYMVSADDWGTQNQTIAAPAVYRELFQPYYRRINGTIHEKAPGVKTFLHSCGAIFDIIGAIAESGFDALNPVQWSAGGHSWKEWKDAARGRIALWGGGVHTQATLPLGSVEEVEREVAEIVAYMKEDGGYVFCAIHNLLAEIAPEKIIAMYRAAARV
jgi:uroporphyrinogen decarboxylase